MAITTKRPPPPHPSSANRDAAIEITSSPDPEPLEEPRPATRSRSTAKRTAPATANPASSTLASPPPSPHHSLPLLSTRSASTSIPDVLLGSSSSSSATKSKPAPKPRPKRTPKSRPVVKKLASLPERVIELSDSSDEEAAEVPVSRAKEHGKMNGTDGKGGEGEVNREVNGKQVNGTNGETNGRAKTTATRKSSANFSTESDDEDPDGGPPMATTTNGEANGNGKGKAKASFSAAHAYDDSDSDEDGPFSTSRRRSIQPPEPLERSQPLDTPNVDGPAKETTPFDDFYTDDEGPGVGPVAPPAQAQVPAPAGTQPTLGRVEDAGGGGGGGDGEIEVDGGGDGEVGEGGDERGDGTPRRRSPSIQRTPRRSPTPTPRRRSPSLQTQPTPQARKPTRDTPSRSPSIQPTPRRRPSPKKKPSTPAQLVASPSLSTSQSPAVVRPGASPSPSKRKPRPSPRKARVSLVPHERHDLGFLEISDDDGDEGFEVGLPAVEPMPLSLSQGATCSSSNAGANANAKSSSSASAGREEANLSFKGDGGGKEKGRPKPKSKPKERRALPLVEEEDGESDDGMEELTQEPTPPSQNTTPPRRSSAPRSSAGPSGTRLPTPLRPGPSNANARRARTPNTNADALRDRTPNPDPWAYDLDELDEDQLQAIAIAAEADADAGGGGGFVGFGGRGVRLDGVGERMDMGRGVGRVGVGVGRDDGGVGIREGMGGVGGHEDEMDEEMARALALSAEWDERERAEREAMERGGGGDVGEEEDAMAMDVDTPAPQPQEYDDDDEDPFVDRPQREVFDISSDAPEPQFDEDFPAEIPVDPVIPDDPSTLAIASILEMIPDVDPDHLLALVEVHLPTYGPNQIVEFLVAHLFENPGYPRVERGKGKGKGKERAVEGGSSSSASAKRKASGDGEGGESASPKKPRIDYASADRPHTGGPHYRDCAIAALQSAFPLIPLPFLRKKLAKLNGLYAPTYLEIRREEEEVESGVGERMYKPKTSAYRGGGGGAKGKSREGAVDEVFEEERRWVQGFVAGAGEGEGSGANPNADAGKGNGEVKADDGDDDDEELEDDGTFVECGCCFSTYPFDRMTTCPDAHLFCRSCLRRYASNELGSQNCTLKCMHTSGCTSLFQESELRRLLPKSLFSLYSRLKQQKELKEANLEGLEECPFCDWACVLEASKEEDRLFRCGNEEECGVVSCRLCRRKEHVPKTCKEAEDDKHLGGRVAIEEAMTRALMRRCPKCDKEFIKSDGCNKMTCPNCRTLSCYVCKQAITGYDHFHQNDPRNPGGSSTNTKCPLWDSVDHRHDQEVKEAYKKALEDYQRDHPDAEVGKDLKIDLPKSPPKQPNALPAGYIDPNALMGGGGGLGMFGGGWHAGWHVHVPPAIPHHLRVEPYERAVLEAQGAVVRAHRALELAAAAQERTQISERDFQAKLWGAEGGITMGSGKRKKGVPSGHHTAAGIAMLKAQLSTASVNRRAAEFRFEGAERELERAQQHAAVLRGDLEERGAALEQWRQQQQAHGQAAAEERRRLMEAEMQRHVQQQRQANEARMRELRERRERMEAQPRVQQRVRAMVVPRRQPVRAPARAPAKTPPKTRKKR